MAVMPGVQPGSTRHAIGLTVQRRILAFDFGFAQTNYCRLRR